MYRFRSWFNSKHGYPVKKYQCRSENFRLFFNIVSESEGPAKSRKESFDLCCDYLNFNGSRSLFVKKPRTCQSNFIQARSVQHRPTPKSVVDNHMSEKNGNKKVSNGRDVSHLSKPRGRNLPKKSIMYENFIFPKTVSFDYDSRRCLVNIQESFCASCAVDSGTAPVTSSHLESTRDTNAKYRLYQNFKIDEALYRELISRQNSPHFSEMADFRKKLPSFAVKDDFLKLLAKNQVVIVTGSTGCGKSTQFPQYVLDDFILSKKGSLCNIICIVPRRVCATSLASRVSVERQESNHRSVGYQIRLNNVLSSRKRGCINFVTTGIFLNILRKERGINRFSHIFVDEAHERGMESDMILAALKQKLNEILDTKIIIMSGTMNSALFSEYMNGAPHIEVPGFLHPIEEYYLEDMLVRMKFKFAGKELEPLDGDFNARVLPYVKSISGRYPPRVITELSKPNSEYLDYNLIANVIEYIVNNGRKGCILVFLPGMQEIFSMDKKLLDQRWYSRDKFVTVWMHSSLSSEQQEKIFSPTPEGAWKIIISTTILETSVTVPEIKYVIDTGRMRKPDYNLEMNMEQLKPVWISKSNARQRKGRAGRVQDGVCIKLYTRGRERCFRDYPVPEFCCSSLEAPLIETKCRDVGFDSKEFFKTLLDPPQTPLVDAGIKNLQEMDIFDSEEKLTPLGKCVEKIRCFHPQLCKLLLLGAIFRCFDPISSIVSALGSGDIFSYVRGRRQELLRIKKLYDEDNLSDHLIISRIVADRGLARDTTTFAEANMVSLKTLEHVRAVKKNLARVLRSMNFLPDGVPHARDNNTHSENTNLVKALLCAGFYPNIAYWRHFPKTGRLQSRRKTPVVFSKNSICSTAPEFESPFFAYFGSVLHHAISISDATMVNPLPLVLFCKRLDSVRRNGNLGHIVRVDDLVQFSIPRQTLWTIQSFRKHLQKILDHCYRNPLELDKLHSTVMPDVVGFLSCQDLEFSREECAGTGRTRAFF